MVYFIQNILSPNPVHPFFVNDAPYAMLKYKNLPSYSVVQPEGQFLLAGYIIVADRGVRQRAQGTF